MLWKKFNAIQTADTSNLVKKADYDTKIRKTKKKLDHDHNNWYIITQEFNRLTAESFTARLETKADITDFVKEKDLDKKTEKLTTKAVK